MRIARRTIGGTFGVIEVAGMLAPDAGQQPVKRLHAASPGRRPIRLATAGAAQGGQQARPE